MIRILAADSSTSINTVAVCETESAASQPPRVLAELIVDCKRLHAERLIATIDCVLHEAGFDLNDINLLAISIGPGSFTGLRIGAATWKGLALAKQLPLLGVPTLDALTRNLFLRDGLLCTVIDARMKEVFGALYRFENGVREKLTPDRVCPVEELLHGLDGPVYFLGDGAAVYRDRIVACTPEPIFVPAHLALPRAAAVAAEALTMFAQGAPADAPLVHPVYLRASQPEMLRAARAKKEAEG